ncbi:protease modulator HflK [Altererythrobacter sp. H2]|uniref:protease modulator HflK n=1 Tax=Altererythrobacter sp. H2 TaxID=3108391 RepID=UPI002B4BA571|nr:protease modulator HflK [Altererythrobacter sp. H2]WRK96938.1 protease modulator HflK [Altererythrobacter sp. H2]
MDMLDGLRKRFGVAMAGKSPWGGSSGGGSDGQGPGGEGGDSGSGPATGGDKKGPRNPWLPGGGDGPRRSANIEDIFKNRGPEGPRRTGGPRGPNFNLPRRPGGGSWLPVLVVGIVSVGLLVSMAHQIAPREQAIVTWLGGKYSHTLEPGFNITMPYPIHQVDREDVREIRLERIPEGTEQKLILTGDQNLANVSYIIRWNIKDLRLFRFQLDDPLTTIKDVAESAMRAAVAEKTLDQTFSGAGRADIEERVMRRMQALLDAYRSGVTIQGVDINKTDPPGEVLDAFRDVSVAEQDANAAMNRSRATAQRILSQAEGETEAFDKVYEQYRLAPEVTRQRLYYETMERVLRETDKTVVETGGVTTYLPLPEIRKRAQERPAAAAAAPTPTPAREQ